MTFDPALLEMVARAITARRCGIWTNLGERLPDDIWQQARPEAEAALTAINASSTHVVAPVVATEEMVLDGVDAWHRTKAPLDKELSAVWSAMLSAAREGK